MILPTEHVARHGPEHGCVGIIEMSTSAAAVLQFAVCVLTAFVVFRYSGMLFDHTINFRVHYLHFIVPVP